MEILLIIALVVTALIIWKWSFIRTVLYVLRYGEPSLHNNITLIETHNPRWKHKRKVMHTARILQQEDFTPLGIYQIPQIPGMLWWAFQRHADGMIAAITDHPLSECAVEFVFSYEDGTGLTISNNMMAAGFEQPPGNEKLYLKNKNIPEMLSMMEERRIDKPICTFDKETFPRYVEKDYAKEMQWRNNKGGISAQELARNFAGSGQKATPEVIAEVAQQMHEQHTDRTRADCLSAFLDQAKTTIACYEDWAERFCVILDSDSPAQIVVTLTDMADLSPEQTARLEQLPTITPHAAKAFQVHCSDILPGIKHLGTTETPASGEIYLLPDREN